MANPDISLLGAVYPTVSGVTLPKQGGGTATFPWVEGSQTYTQNGTYDVSSLSEAVVNVSGGGGGSSYTLLGSAEYSVNTTSTSSASVGTISCGSAGWTSAKIIYVRIRDKAGKRNGYFYGSDTWFLNINAANGSASSFSSNVARQALRFQSNGTWALNINTYGIYANSITKDSATKEGVVSIYSRYNSSYSLTINGTYKCEVYALEWPGNVSPFA